MLLLDAIFGRAHQSILLVAPLVLVPAFISNQKQHYLSDPLYPSDFLFARQIMELMPVIVRERPWTAVAVAIGIVASTTALAPSLALCLATCGNAFAQCKDHAAVHLPAAIGRLRLADGSNPKFVHSGKAAHHPHSLGSEGKLRLQRIHHRLLAEPADGRCQSASGLWAKCDRRHTRPQLCLIFPAHAKGPTSSC